MCVCVLLLLTSLCMQMYDDVCTMGMMGLGWCGVPALNYSTPNVAVGPQCQQ